ncbi:MAG: hypothetical protein P1V81_14940 [Planctomycetota bacterium]|nr:hypothetical protein [Planctomycetota bacterium]
MGMPKEGVGVSGPPPSFLPTFDGARFMLDADHGEQTFALVYL